MAEDRPVLTFTGLANASAAVALDDGRFVLADDEGSKLFLFDFDQPGRSPDEIPLAIGDGEPDLEGAAMHEGRIWWITSHSSNGKKPKARRRLFLTDVKWQDDRPSFCLGDHIHLTLLDDLAQKPSVAEALGHGGEGWENIDIEGLAATPAGGLLLGFRAPLNEGRAIIVEIVDAAALARGEAPDLADPVCLDLGGRGIRSIERIDGGYLLVGGKIKDDKKAKLFFWSGQRSDDPVALDWDLPNKFNPEGMFHRPGTSTLCVISDDGRLYEDVDPSTPRNFRALLLDLDDVMS